MWKISDGGGDAGELGRGEQRVDEEERRIAMNDIRTPKFSRKSAARPLPVTQPMRVAISCTTISATASGTSVQSTL